ncbi:MAG: NUDIX domain-containing protein [Faecousia sp.]
MEELRDARGMTEAEAIARYHSRNYPKPALTADIVVLSCRKAETRVLLIRRKNHPFLGKLALPGGFANENEPIEATAVRELEEETGVAGLPVKLIGVFSQPGRDPRGWVVSAAFLAAVDPAKVSIQAGDDASEAAWYLLEEEDGRLMLRRDKELISAESLAFDHREILKKALAADR